jgi:hypothetical protein
VLFLVFNRPKLTQKVFNSIRRAKPSIFFISADGPRFGNEKYRNNDRVMQINGSFYLDNLINPKESYYFSKIISCWSWATWKSYWGSFDETMSDYERLKNNGLIEKYYNKKHISNWMERFFNEKTSS